MQPSSGPAAGGTNVSIAGTDFGTGASVSIGGVAATNVDVVGFNSITASTPALPPGAVHDLTVANTDGSVGTLLRGWVSDFLDVPAADQFHSDVVRLFASAITAGVGNGNFGRNEPTLRQQMAVFLLKAEHGICYVPPTCTGLFSDVPCPSPFADWVEAFASEGITAGCGAGTFCPTSPVRRDQMAVFLLKTTHGAAYVPPPCIGGFADVECPSPFADWVERLAAEGITAGCGDGNYCPLSNNTRGQMAVFITKAFQLQ
jgi:hypothetical protein